MDGSMHWEVDAAVLEAIVGLWTWSLVISDDDLPWEGPFYRIVGQNHQEDPEEILLMYHKWIFRDTEPILVLPDLIPLSRGMFGWRISQEPRITATGILATETHQPLHVMAAQDIYIYFLNSAFKLLMELGGETEILPNGRSFFAHSSRIEQLVRCFEANHLGSRQDALLCIVPALRRRGILPELCADSPPVRQLVEKYIAAGEWSEAFSLLDWFCKCSGGNEFECSANEMGYLCCRAMLNPERSVRELGFKRVLTAIEHELQSGFTYIAGNRLSNWVLCEKKATYWSAFSRQLGWVAWHIANRLHEQSFVQYLTSQGVDQDCIGRDNGDQSSASLIGRDRVISWLTAGDDILGRDISHDQEKLSLDWLIEKGHNSLLHWMMIRWTELGASYPHFLQAVLQLVSQCRSDAAIQIMCRHGADINARSNVDITGGPTALMQKIIEGDEESVLRLLRNGADANAASPSNLTPLMLACSEGYTQIAKKLLQYGAHIDARDRTTYSTALNAAADNNHLTVVQLLAEQGAYIDHTGIDGMTPFLSAVSQRNIDIAEFLMGRGANINAQNDFGYSALMLAISNNDASMISKLLKWGCDVNAKDTSGMTAFDWARSPGKGHCLEFLESAQSQEPVREVA